MAQNIGTARFRWLGSWLPDSGAGSEAVERGAAPIVSMPTLSAPSITAEAEGLDAQRVWLLQGADELFRGIYTRAGIGIGETLAVCSAIAGEGKTTIGLGLATTIAQDFPDRRVLVVETDFVRPVLARDFGLDAQPGLIECLSQGTPLSFAYRETRLPNLHLLPAGGPPLNSERLLRSSRMAATVDAMRQSHDLVIFDVPAVLANSDSIAIADLADGVLLVVSAGVTPAAQFLKAASLLDADRIRGTVVNRVKPATPAWMRRLLGI
jgi:Mrp family chromosome partitioning ATPase